MKAKVSLIPIPCVHSMTDHNGNLVVGYYVFDPDDQIKLRMILDKID